MVRVRSGFTRNDFRISHKKILASTAAHSPPRPGRALRLPPRILDVSVHPREVLLRATDIFRYSSFPIDNISCSAPLQGTSTYGRRRMQASSTSIIAALILSLPFRDLQDLIGLHVSQYLHVPLGQRSSISLTTESRPKPKCARLSDELA